MRLISQDGTVDVPYEFTSLVADGEYIKAITNGKKCVMGTYSSEEKSDKVMKMLHSKSEECLYCEGGPMATANFYVPAFAFTPPKVFQFPEDDEVEE